MLRGGHQTLLSQVQLDVDRAREERAPRAEHELARIERVLDRPERRGLRHLAQLRGRRVLPFGQSVDLVVEQQDIDVDIAPHGMDEMIPSDRQRVAVAGHLPYRQLRIGHLDAGSDSRRPAVNPVKAERVHIVREAGRTADARHEGKPFVLVMQRLGHLGKRPDDRRQDRMIAASGTPLDLLIALEVGRRVFVLVVLFVVHGYDFNRRANSSLSSVTVKGSPCILLY